MEILCLFWFSLVKTLAKWPDIIKPSTRVHSQFKVTHRKSMHFLIMRGLVSFFNFGIVLKRQQSFICLLSMRILLFEDAWPFHQSHPKPLWIHQGQLLKSVSFRREVEKTATTIRRKLHHDFALFDLAGAERGEARCKKPQNL